jgi:putative ABC transport system permease protein
MMTRRLFRRWLRNLLTVVAIAISFSMLISMASVSLGIHESSLERISNPPRDLVISSLGLDPSINNAHEQVGRLESDRQNISDAMPLLTVLGRLGIPENDERENVTWNISDPREIEIAERVNIGAVGLIPYTTDDFRDKEGRLSVRSDVLEMENWFSSGGDPFYSSGYTGGWTGEMILDEVFMHRYGVEKGDLLYFLDNSGLPRSSFKIIGSVKTSLLGGGISSNILGGIAVFRLGELQYATGYHHIDTPQGPLEDLCTLIYVKLAKGVEGSDTQKAVENKLQERYPGLMVTTEEVRLYRLEEEALILEVFSFSVGVSTLFIGLLFLSSIMLIDVDERKGELAIMKAIGISKRTIFLQVLTDSFILSGLGAVFGVILGIMGSRYVDLYLRNLYGVNVIFSYTTPSLILLMLIFLGVNVVIFSIVPAYRGMSQDHRRALGGKIG